MTPNASLPTLTPMRNQTIHIRPAEFKDAESIFTLIKKHPEEVLARPIGDIVQNIDRFIVCEKDHQVVGTVSWYILPEIGSPKEPSIEIKSLAVDPDHLGIGIGTQLVTEAIKHITTLQPAQIIALTFTPEFFKRFNFTQVAKETLMHKIYAGCINCTKYDSPFTCPEVAMQFDPSSAFKAPQPEKPES